MRDIALKFSRFFSLLVVGLFVLAVPAYACSCLPGTTGDYFKNADLVFEGTVSGLTLAEGEAAEIGADYNTIVLTVSKSYKGETGEEVTLQTATNSAACGVTFEDGASYFVFANKVDGTVSTNLCSGTVNAESASEGTAAELQRLADAPPANGQMEEDEILTTNDLATLVIRLQNTTTATLLFSILNTVALLFVGVYLSVRIADRRRDAKSGVLTR